MSTYSFSQIGTFQTCPRKYQYRYIDGLAKDTKEDSLTLSLGTVFHGVLEYIYKSKSNTIIVSHEQALATYNELWKQELDKYLEMPLQSDIDMFQSRGHEYLKRYYDTYYPFDVRVMAIEDWVRVRLESNIDFTGKVDRLDAAGDTIVITDYKTSRRLQPDQEDHNREQIVLYAYGVRQSYGRKFKQIQGSLIYPHLQKEYRFTIDDDEISEVVEKYLLMMRDIEARKANHENLFASGVDQFPPIAGNHCQHCPFRQICPKWKHEFTDEEFISSDLGEQTITNLVSDYLHINEQYKKLEAERKYLTELITQWMQSKDISKRETNSGAVGMQSSTSYSIKADHRQELTDYLQSHGLLEELSIIQSQRFASKIKSGDIPLEEIQERVEPKTSSRLSPKKMKE